MSKKYSKPRMFDLLPHLVLPRPIRHDPHSVRTLDVARRFIRNGATKIVIDNAHRYLLEAYPLTPDGPREMDHKDWPAFNSPFRRVWMEYAVSRRDDEPHFAGAIVSRADVKKTDNEPEAAELIEVLQPDLDERGVHFVIALNLFESFRGHVLPMGDLCLYVGEHGNHIDCYCPVRDISNAQRNKLGELATTMIFGMAFSACSNVERIPVSPDREGQRQHQRRHGQSLSRYHVLAIDARTRAEYARNGGNADPSDLCPFHIVRGNFAKYGIDGRGLYFGRGDPRQIWRPEHARGDARNGIVRKDYTIGKTPDAA